MINTHKSHIYLTCNNRLMKSSRSIVDRAVVRRQLELCALVQDLKKHNYSIEK
jgi:hypothetical protein